MIIFQVARAGNYNLQFTASGVSSTIDSVSVQNISLGETVTFSSGTVFILTDAHDYLIKNDFIKVYPNPIQSSATVSFYTSKGGSSFVRILGIDGRNIISKKVTFQTGTNYFRLALPKGIYILSIIENGLHYNTKIISLSIDNNIDFEITGNKPAELNLLQEKKSSQISLRYRDGDLLLIKAYSGNHATVIFDRIKESKTINFVFVECKDADENYYPVTKIGKQIWMVENLKSSKYRNGELIGTTKSSEINNLSESARKYQYAYNDEEVNIETYGRLYTWNVLTDNRNISPRNWRIPTEADWAIMENFLVANAFGFDGNTTENNLAKSLASNMLWNTSTENGTIGNDLTTNNSSCFSALPGGKRDDSGEYNAVLKEGYWWSASELSASNALCIKLAYNNSSISREFLDKNAGLSVRCIREDLPIVNTKDFTDIKSSNAICGGFIYDTEGPEVTARGVCWSAKKNPTVNDSITSDGTGTGHFISKIVGLLPGKTYYVRAYATNSIGTSYGREIAFSTMKIINPYENVNFRTNRRYKTNLHSHTTNSDGADTPAKQIEKHLLYGFDILAITDHDGYKKSPTFPWSNYIKEKPVAFEGKQCELYQISGKNILAVKGNELGQGGFLEDHHRTSLLNGLWESNLEYVEWGLHKNFETRFTYADEAIYKNNGVWFFNHPDQHYKFYSFDWYLNFLKKSKSAVGIEVFTNYDHKAKDLWEFLLVNMMPYQPVWGHATSDDHGNFWGPDNKTGVSYDILFMEDLSPSSFRKAMLNGESYFIFDAKGNNLNRHNPDVTPVIKSIDIDETSGKITIEADNCSSINWVFNNQTIGTGNTFQLGRKKINYIRAELIGDKGGTAYTQPFGIIYPEQW